jgi:hypothetical protein
LDSRKRNVLAMNLRTPTSSILAPNRLVVPLVGMSCRLLLRCVASRNDPLSKEVGLQKAGSEPQETFLEPTLGCLRLDKSWP